MVTWSGLIRPTCHLMKVEELQIGFASSQGSSVRIGQRILEYRC